MPDTWKPIRTPPAVGKFLIERRAPTDWDPWVGTVVLHENDLPRVRQARLKYAVAWMDYPPESGFTGDEDG